MKNLWLWVSELFGCIALFGTFYICYLLLWATFPGGF
jgi:hypothetical protein